MSSTHKIVAVELDDFIRNKDSFYWYAVLSDGTTVYQDDDRPELEEKNAWLRLKKYCELNKIYVVKVGLKFYSNFAEIDTSDWDGVFFIKSVLGFIRIRRNKSDKPMPTKRYPSRHFYNIGRLVGDKIIVQKWEMPVVLYRTDDVRDLKPNDETSLIRKP